LLSKAKKNLLLQKGAATDHILIGRTQWLESQLSFYLCLSLTLMDGFGFTIFTIGYLEKGHVGFGGPWSKENKKILSGNIHFKQAVWD
jgi:hypothetical protein